MKWINALRSGEYKQTKARLQDNSGFCCLGVACKLFIPEDQQRYSKRYDANTLDGERPEDQPFAPEWLKAINTNFTDMIGHGLEVFNDGYDGCLKIEPLSFDEIADLLQLIYIESAL